MVFKLAWSKNGTPNTLSGTADDMDITDLTAKKFNQFLVASQGSSSNQTQQNFTFENNSNTVYARRSSGNGGADTTGTSATFVTSNYGISNWGDQFTVMYGISISGEEKLFIYYVIWGNTAGAANAPERVEVVAKFVPSPDSDITRIDINNSGSGDFQIGDNVSALGTD